MGAGRPEQGNVMRNIPKVVITIPSPEAIEEVLRNKAKVREEPMNSNRKPYAWDQFHNELQELADSKAEFEGARSVPTVTEGVVELVADIPGADGPQVVLVTHATSMEDAHARFLKHPLYLDLNETEA